MTVEDLRRHSFKNHMLRLWHVFRLFLMSCKFHICKVTSNWIDAKEGVMEYRVAKLYGRAILDYMGHTVKVEGKENVEELDYFCVAANHGSYLDWVVMLAEFPSYLRFIAKKELTYIPVIGSHLALCGVLIDRKGKRSALEAIERAILDGNKTPILIFPEGTRPNDGVPSKFKKGGLGLFAKHSVPILPVTILNTFEHLPRNAMTFKPGGELKMIIGNPLYRKDFSSDAAMLDAVEEVVHQTYKERGHA